LPASVGAADHEPGASLRLGTHAHHVHVVASECPIEIGNPRYAEIPGELLVERFASRPDARLVGHADQAATRIGGKIVGVAFLVRMPPGEQENAVRRFRRLKRVPSDRLRGGIRRRRLVGRRPTG
jgi:hypothetical protein